MDHPNEPEIRQWSDELCFELAEKHHFPSSVKRIDVQKEIISTFYNFYLSGKRPVGIKICDIVFSVLAIMPTTPVFEEIIWPTSEYKDDGSLFLVASDVKPNTTAEPSNNQQSVNFISQDKINESAEVPTTNKDQIVNASHESTPARSESPDRAFLADENDEDIVGEILNCDTDENSVQLRMRILEKSIFPSHSDWFSPSRTTDHTPSEIIEYGPVENAAFTNSIKVLLGQWSDESRGSKSRAILKYFFGVIALVFMRSTAKSHKHLDYVFSNAKFKTMIQFSQNAITFCKPPRRCLKSVHRAFLKRDGNTPVMFAKIIRLYTQLHSNHKLKLTIRNALLIHTSGYGFNLVNMWRTIVYSPGVTVKQVKAVAASLSRNIDTQASWSRLINFNKKYPEYPNNYDTYYWARLLSTEYFKDLSCQQNYTLAVVLAYFVEKITGTSGVWQSIWVKSGDVEKAKEIATDFYEKFLIMK